MNGDDIESLLAKVPDEFYKWVRDTKADLEAKYKVIEKECTRCLMRLSSIGPDMNPRVQRKNEAIYIQKMVPKNYQGIVFSMLDKKDYSKAIWTLIRPEFEKPFWNKDETIA